MKRNDKRIWRRAAAWCLSAVLLFSLCACGESAVLKDGVYTKKSGTEKNGGYVEVTLTVTDGKMSACSMVMYDRNGKEKGEDYGSGGSEQVYKLAQAAVKGAMEYPEMLIRAGDIEEIDAVSGATETFDVFRAAVIEILQEAEQK